MVTMTIGAYELQVYADETFEDRSYEFYYPSAAVAGHTPPSTGVGVKVLQDGVVLHSGLTVAAAGATGVYADNVVFEKDRLLFACSNELVCLLVPSLQLLWRQQVDPVCCFDIYRYQQDYILHCELNICRIDLQGNILWSASGMDIFTTLQGGYFELQEDHILVKDFEYRLYRIDCNTGAVTMLGDPSPRATPAPAAVGFWQKLAGRLGKRP